MYNRSMHSHRTINQCNSHTCMSTPGKTAFKRILMYTDTNKNQTKNHKKTQVKQNRGINYCRHIINFKHWRVCITYCSRLLVFGCLDEPLQSNIWTKEGRREGDWAGVTLEMHNQLDRVLKDSGQTIECFPCAWVKEETRVQNQYIALLKQVVLTR